MTPGVARVHPPLPTLVVKEASRIITFRRTFGHQEHIEVSVAVNSPSLVETSSDRHVTKSG